MVAIDSALVASQTERSKRPAHSRQTSRKLANRQHKLPLFKPYGGEPYEPMNSTLPITQSGYFLTGVASNLLFARAPSCFVFARTVNKKSPAERRSSEFD